MLSPADFGCELLVSDRPFAERVVSVISAFLGRYRATTGADHGGWPRCFDSCPRPAAHDRLVLCVTAVPECCQSSAETASIGVA